MRKRILAFVLCLSLLLASVFSFSGCTTLKGDDKGQYIKMYITDDMYDLDPAHAYSNPQVANIVGLLFDTLFKLDDNGKVVKSLVKSYKFFQDDRSGEYKMSITLKKTYWSDGTYLSADDVCFAWKRLLDVEGSYEAACLLYDIKNARAIKNGECTIDDIGLEAQKLDLVITFENKINYDQFLLNLTSIALAPLRETIVTKSDDWAKKSSTICCSGPFRLGKVIFEEGDARYYDPTNIQYNTDKDDETLLVSYYPSPKYLDEVKLSQFILERNSYYFRNREKDALDKYVLPYRIVVEAGLSDEELQQKYADGEILYMANIPLSLRETYKKKAKVSNDLSTHIYVLNENALISRSGSTEGEKLFQNEKVRQALSMVINREAIAEALVFADAATGLVPNGIYNTGTKGKMFRTVGGKLLATTDDMAAAKALLADAGVMASKYSFKITVAAYDEVDLKIAEMVCEAWNNLGFNVSLYRLGTIANNDWYKPTSSIPKDISDDLYSESLRSGNFEVIAMDYRSLSTDAYSMLAQYASGFCGGALDLTDSGEQVTHFSGYYSEDYDTIIEAIYFLPYYSKITGADFAEFGIFDNADDFQALLDAIGKIYEENGIHPAKSKKWTAAKTKLLHLAEEKLMEDLPIIPIVFNKTAVVYSSKLKGVKDTCYYFDSDFSRTQVRNYKSYKNAYLAQYYE